MSRATIVRAPLRADSIEKKLRYLYHRRALITKLIHCLEQYADTAARSAYDPAFLPDRGHITMQRLAS